MLAFIHGLLLALLFFGIGFSFHLYSRHTYLLKDSHEFPTVWSRVRSAHPEFLSALRMGLKQSRLDELEERLYEVSIPSHERYGKHLTRAEVTEIIKPSEDALQDLHDWLEIHGIDRAQLIYFTARDLINIQLFISNIERLLNSQYSIYEHQDGTQLVRAAAWSLSSHLHEHIEIVQHTNFFIRLRPPRTSLDIVQHDIEILAEPCPHQKKVSKDSKDAELVQVCATTFDTSNCLRTLYGSIDYVSKVPGKKRVALSNYDGQTSNHSDAVPAAQTFIIDVDNDGADHQSLVNAIQAEVGFNKEGNLDAELLFSFGCPTPLIAYKTGGEPSYQVDASEGLLGITEPYLEWLQYVLAQDNIPQVIGSSYGDDEQIVPYSYAAIVCNLFAQLGARGVPFLCASGANNIGPSGECFTNDEKNIPPTFLPHSSKTCPYVTSVGALQPRNCRLKLKASGSLAVAALAITFLVQSTNTASSQPISLVLDPNTAVFITPAGALTLILQFKASRVATTTWNGRGNPIDDASASTPITAADLRKGMVLEGPNPLRFEHHNRY